MMCQFTTFLIFFYYFRRRHRITPRVALPPPTRNAYSRSTSFSQQSGVYSRSSSFDQQTSGFQQRSESSKPQQQPAATRRPDTYAAESALEDRLVRIYLSYFHHPRSFYAQIKVKLNHWKFDFTSVFTCY